MLLRTFKKFKNAKQLIKDDLLRIYANELIKKNGFWFIDLPRTSSSSVKVFLYSLYSWPYGKNNVLENEYAVETVYPDHLTVDELVICFGKRNWNKLRKFTIVRNPYTRIYSMYFYRIKTQKIHPSISFKDFINCIYDHFSKKTKWDFLSAEKIWMPQTNFLTHKKNISDNIKIIKYESERNQSIVNFLGIKKENGILLTKFIQKCSDPNIINNIDKNLDSEVIEKINEIYNNDFNNFNYKKL